MIQRKTKPKSKRNAIHVKFGNIEFKSILEYDVYKTLLEAGFKPAYEKRKYTLIEGFKPSVPFYTKSKGKVKYKQNNRTIQDTSYIPDFTFKYKGYFIIVEAKGKIYDDYDIKRKLFRQQLEKVSQYEKILFFEVYSKKNVLQMIEILNGL